MAIRSEASASFQSGYLAAAKEAEREIEELLAEVNRLYARCDGLIDCEAKLRVRVKELEGR